jgi:hypothetical protein
MPRIRRIGATLDLRGIPPEQPSLPYPVQVTSADRRHTATLSIRRRGTLPRTVGLDSIAGNTPPPPDNLPTVVANRESSQAAALSHDTLYDEPLYIPDVQPRLSPPMLSPKFGLSLSFGTMLLLAALLVPAMALVGSAFSLERTLTAKVADAAQTLEHAAAAMAAMDTSSAQAGFSEARDAFQSARTQLSRLGFGLFSLVAELPVSARLTSGHAVLEGGEHLAQAGESLAAALQLLEAFSPEALITGALAPPGNITPPAHAQLAGDGEAFEEALLRAAAHLDAAASALARIDIDAVPAAHRTQVEQLRAGIPLIRSTVQGLHGNARAIAGMLGMRGVRRYIVLLQNASELRPTGGFVGNVALLTVHQGRLVEFSVEDAYHLDGQIIRYTVPPEPLQDISAAWSLHDANWYRDFPETARIASGFYEDTGDATPDGVFAITSHVLEAMLAATGPVTTDTSITFSSTNVVDQLNAIGAAQRPGETTQLRALANLLPALLAQLTEESADTAELRERFAAAVAAGDIQMWFRDADEQRLASQLGLSGSIPDSFSGDFLAVVHANVNGYKSEHVLSETVAHDVFLQEDGSLEVALTISRHHHGDMAQESFYRQVSKSWSRILVPKGAQLLAASGFTCKPDAPLYAVDYEALGYRTVETVHRSETTFTANPETCVSVGEESGKTAFAGWLFTSPGETTELRLRYRLPFTLTAPADSYRLLVLKQPGFTAAFRTTLHTNARWNIAWRDEHYTATGNSIGIPQAPLKENRFLGAVLTKE